MLNEILISMCHLAYASDLNWALVNVLIISQLPFLIFALVIFCFITKYINWAAESAVSPFLHV